MRICYIADGRYVHTHRWMRFFKEKGHDVHLISFAPMMQPDVAAVTDAGGVYHGAHENFHLKRFWLTTRSLKFIKTVLRREEIDVLHCHFLGANAWYAALSGFRPFVITVMGGGDICGPEWQPQGARARVLTPFALRRAALITS